MTQEDTIDSNADASVLEWAASRRIPATVSIKADDNWSVLKSQILRCDEISGVLQISYPTDERKTPVELTPGQPLGIAFRRGHKKCLFTTAVIVRRTEDLPELGEIDTVVLRCPDHIREVQRRAYQRVTVPPEIFIAIKLWEGGAPTSHEPTWPICAGRIGNASVGGVLIDVREDQNPRLTIGDLVGVEITASPGKAPLIVEAQYRHCAVTTPGRLGLGFQFVGLEHDLPGRASLNEVTHFVRGLQRDASRRDRSAERPRVR